MQFLVDSNILLRLVNPADPQNPLAWGAVRKLHSKQDQLCVVPQNIYEFWSVATRPTNVNGLGFTVAGVQSEVARLRKLFVSLDEVSAFIAEWENLVIRHAIV